MGSTLIACSHASVHLCVSCSVRCRFSRPGVLIPVRRSRFRYSASKSKSALWLWFDRRMELKPCSGLFSTVKDIYGADIEFYVPDIEVITASGHWDLPIPADWVDFDVLWSPDSKFVALTGNLNGYIESVRVFQITESGPVSIDVAKMPFADMIRRFPPCRAAHADPTVCAASHDDKDFNFAAIAWTGTHTLVLMSEVPCTSLWGGIMCQVMGYEVDPPGGNIVETMTARDFQRKWQHEIAWSFHIPEPPEWQN